MDQGIIDPSSALQAGGLSRLDVPVDGMSRATCVTRVERVASRVAGVHAAVASLASERVSLRTGPAFQLPELTRALDKAGYKAAERVADLAIIGMSCAACANRIERALMGVPGVLAADVNPATDRVRVRILANVGNASLAQAVGRAGYDVAPAAAEAAAAGPARRTRRDGMGWPPAWHSHWPRRCSRRCC